MFDIVAIGTATRDVFLRSSQLKVLRDPKHLREIGFLTGEAECFALGSKIGVEEPFFTIGGGAANAAVTFARQGLRTAALLRVGNDESAEAILRRLREEKVIPFAVRDKNKGTAYSTILLTRAGERTVLVYRGASEGLAKKEIPLTKIEKTRWAYIAPGGTAFDVIKDLVIHLKRKGVMLAMNPSRYYLEMGASKLKEILGILDVVIVNREEAAELTGVDYKKSREIFRKFDDLVPGIAVVTAGAEGAMVSDGRYLYKAGVFKEKELIDRTGAGDAFGSGFVVGLILKRDINFALRLASANATSVVEKIGAEEGILRQKDFSSPRWKYLDLDIEPL
jgi:ribokinase